MSDIDRSVRKIERILQDLINSDPLQPLEAGRARCDIGALVAAAVNESDIGQHHPVHLLVEPVVINVDAAQVERIVDNLLGNAIKHVPAGVDVWITVARADHGVLITVDDAGPGVPAALQTAIFEPFRRGDAPASPGLGIGLSLVSRFAQVHGGRAWVQDRPGGPGASFRVFLPDTDPSDTDTRPLIRVVLCDDDRQLSEVFSTLIGLDPALHLVTPPVETGQDAINAVIQHRPDVVLMDVNLLGGMNGFDAARTIRAESPSTQVVIMSSASNTDRMRAQAIAAGAASYLPKTEAGSALLPALHSAAAS